MGRPPCYGVPAFRFTKAEVAEMETIIHENNNMTPDPQILEALARKFSESVDRKGKVAVQAKQVWHWFQNKKYAIRAKSRESTSSKISRPPFLFFTKEIAEMETILQEHNNAMPPFQILIDLAKKFSDSPDRKSYTVLGIQVWNWFHNKRHGIRAKPEKSGAKFDVSPITLDMPTLMRYVPQPSNASLPAPMLMPIPVHVPECAPALRISCTSSAGLEIPSLKPMPVPVPGPAPAPVLASTSSENCLLTSIPALVPEPTRAPALGFTSSAQGPTPALDSTSVLAVSRALRKICSEFEAKSSRDGAWHIVASFLSYRDSVMGDMEVLVHFAVFGEEDEWVNVRKHVRLRSLANQQNIRHFTTRRIGA